MIEKEYKFETEVSTNKLLSLGFEIKYSDKLLTNTMYDNGHLETLNERLRVREVSGGDKYLTYKKPLKSEGNAKRETEYEITFQGDIKKILENIGFSIPLLLF